MEKKLQYVRYALLLSCVVVLGILLFQNYIF